MRKIIAVAAMAILTMATIYSCNKKGNETNKSWDSTQNEGKYQTMSGGLSVGQFHNVIMEIYDKKYIIGDNGAINRDSCIVIATRLVAIMDSVSGTTDYSSCLSTVIAIDDTSGAYDAFGMYKGEAYRTSRAIERETDPDFKAALINISSSTDTGVAFLNFVKDEIDGLSLTGNAALRAAGYRDVFCNSFLLNETVYHTMGSKSSESTKAINRADAAAYALGFFDAYFIFGGNLSSAEHIAQVCSVIASAEEAEHQKKK